MGKGDFKMIKTIKDFYSEKKNEYENYKNMMLKKYSYIFKDEKDLETCRKLYQTRYFLKNGRQFDDDVFALDVSQAYRTMLNCQKVVFGDKMSEECLESVKAYDEIKDNMEVVKGFLDIESAIVINDYVVARIVKAEDYEFFSLSRLFNSTLLEYTDPEFEPDEVEKNEAFEYWKNKGMM